MFVSLCCEMRLWGKEIRRRRCVIEKDCFDSCTLLLCVWGGGGGGPGGGTGGIVGGILILLFLFFPCLQPTIHLHYLTFKRLPRDCFLLHMLNLLLALFTVLFWGGTGFETRFKYRYMFNAIKSRQYSSRSSRSRSHVVVCWPRSSQWGYSRAGGIFIFPDRPVTV